MMFGFVRESESEIKNKEHNALLIFYMAGYRHHFFNVFFTKTPHLLLFLRVSIGVRFFQT